MGAIRIGILAGLMAMLLFALVSCPGKVRSWLRAKATFLFSPWLWVALIIGLIPLYVREATRPTWYLDYYNFLAPWISYINANGGWETLSHDYSNYTPPYLYILTLIAALPVDPLIAIRVVSILFSIVGGVFIGKILYLKNPERWVIPCGLFTSLALPTVWLNGAYWAQCDSIYTSLIIISLYYLLKKQQTWSWIWLGIALSFKLQTVFILPLFVLLWMRGSSKWWMPLVSIVAVALMWLPASVVGRPISQLLELYQQQVDESNTSAISLPNFWSLFPEGTEYQGWHTLLMLAIIAILGIYICIATRERSYSDKFIIVLSMLMAVVIPFLLPKMHERYLYLADILAVVYIFYCPKMWLPVIGLQVVSLSGYMYYLAWCTQYRYFTLTFADLLPFTILYLVCVATLFYYFFTHCLPRPISPLPDVNCKKTKSPSHKKC